MYREVNANPKGKYVGDCVIRAIATATGETWEKTYAELAVQGFIMCDMPSSNHVWGSYLSGRGFKRAVVPNTCPDCYTVKDFARDHAKGTYIAATGSHVVAIINGDYYDTWDSGDEAPIYYWEEARYAE